MAVAVGEGEGEGEGVVVGVGVGVGVAIDSARREPTAQKENSPVVRDGADVRDSGCVYGSIIHVGADFPPP